jgi:AcrR family transcriptional regulator
MPPKFKTEAEKQAARTQILDAARELFVAKGVEAVTMREIAKKIGYSATTIYLHFKDKEALIHALCLTDFKRLGVELAEILQNPEPVARLVDLGAAYARFALAYPYHYRMMFMTEKPPHALQEDEIDPSWDAYKLLNDVVNEVYQAGYFLPEYDNPELIAQTVWAAIHGVCSLEITMKNDCHIAWCDILERVQFMQKVALRGLLKTTIANTLGD